MDCKTWCILGQCPHNFGVEICWQFLSVVMHELDFNIAPGLDGMIGVHLAVLWLTASPNGQ